MLSRELSHSTYRTDKCYNRISYIAIAMRSHRSFEKLNAFRPFLSKKKLMETILCLKLNAVIAH